MTARLDGDLIRLEGACHVEEAEVLAGLLAAGPRSVDLTACQTLHAAVAQVLLAYRPPLQGQPADPFLSGFLVPALEAVGAGDNPGPGGYGESGSRQGVEGE